MSTQTLYQVLGVQMDVSEEELKKAYLRIARECHPDRTKDDPVAAERFKRAAEALAILSDKDKRQAYDRTVAVPQSVTELLTRNRAGSRLVAPLLPTAPAEPKPGTHLAGVVKAAHAGAIWERTPGKGEIGKNGGESGDAFTLHLPK